jgi:hypothetical protein
MYGTLIGAVSFVQRKTMFLDDAELKTESWRLRHSPEAIRTLGVWRWKGMQRHMERILSLCVGKRVIDFGGADGPLGLGSIVVDQKATIKTLDDVPGLVDVIFTSHCLEHTENPAGIIGQCEHKLVAGGALVVHVPAWTCKRWRAEEYGNPAQNDHLWTFYLSTDNPLPWREIQHSAYAIDLMIHDIELAEHCGDNSLMVIGRKR